MSLNRVNTGSNNSGNIEFKLTNAPEGENEGRLAFVADLGVQRKEYQGEYMGDVQQIALGIELVGQTVEIDGKEEPRLLWTKPFYIYPKMGEKSKEFAYYKVFDPMAQPETVPDWDAQLGKPCNVIVKHVKGKGDKADRVYDNIADIVAIPQKYQGGVAAMKMVPAIGNAEDEENPAQKKMFGLTRIVWERRIKNVEDSVAAAKAAEFDDDVPY